MLDLSFISGTFSLNRASEAAPTQSGEDQLHPGWPLKMPQPQQPVSARRKYPAAIAAIKALLQETEKASALANCKNQSTRKQKKSSRQATSSTPAELAPHLYTTKEVAKALNFDEATIRRKAAAAWLPGSIEPCPIDGLTGWYVSHAGNIEGGRGCGWKLQKVRDIQQTEPSPAQPHQTMPK